METDCVLMEITLGLDIRPIQHWFYSTRGMAGDPAIANLLDIWLS